MYILFSGFIIRYSIRLYRYSSSLVLIMFCLGAFRRKESCSLRFWRGGGGQYEIEVLLSVKIKKLCMVVLQYYYNVNIAFNMRLIKNLLFNNKFPSDKYDKLYLFIIGLLCDVTLLILFLCVYVFFFQHICL